MQLLTEFVHVPSGKRIFPGKQHYVGEGISTSGVAYVPCQTRRCSYPHYDSTSESLSLGCLYHSKTTGLGKQQLVGHLFLSLEHQQNEIHVMGMIGYKQAKHCKTC